MRTDLIGARAVGFALGILCLALTLKVLGTSPGHVGQGLPHGVVQRTVPPGAAALPDLSNIPKPRPLEPPSNDLLSNFSASGGEADRLVSEDHPIVPIAGIPASRLSDTFNEIHNGHKHEALDIPAVRGTPVRAAVEGNVVKLFTSKQGGLTVYQFDDARNLCYYYAHLDHYAAGLREGALLRQGDVLGYVGSTGNASPRDPHLHFAVFRLDPDKKWYHGTAIDPLPMLR